MVIPKLVIDGQLLKQKESVLNLGGSGFVSYLLSSALVFRAFQQKPENAIISFGLFVCLPVHI